MSNHQCEALSTFARLNYETILRALSLQWKEGTQFSTIKMIWPQRVLSLSHLWKKRKIYIDVMQIQRLASGEETGRARPRGASSSLVERDITGFILTTWTPPFPPLLILPLDSHNTGSRWSSSYLLLLLLQSYNTGFHLEQGLIKEETNKQTCSHWRTEIIKSR